MDTMLTMFRQWQLDVGVVRKPMYRALTPRERRHAIWLLARGWSAAQVAEALERDAHTIGDWLEAFREQGPAGLASEQTGGAPRPQLDRTSGVEGGGSRYATGGRYRLGELEGSALVRRPALWRQVVSQQPCALSASPGLCAEVAQEASAESQC